jgi:hypothetical protein
VKKVAVKRLVVIAGAIALTIGTVAGATAVAQAQDSPSEAPLVISELATERDGFDALPSKLPVDEIGEGGLDTSSARLLATDSGRRFWAALDATGDVCLIVALGDKGETIAATCGSPDAVAAEGLLLGFQGSGGTGAQASVAYLLPDSAVAEKAPAPWRLAAPNVIVAPAADAAGSAGSVPGTDGAAPIALVP